MFASSTRSAIKFNSCLSRALVLFGVLAVFTLLCLSFAYGQNGEGRSVKSLNTDQMIEGWRAELDQIASAIKRDSVSENELVTFRARVSKIRDEAVQFSEKLTPEVQSLTARLEKLSKAENATLVPEAAPPGADASSAAPGDSGKQPEKPAATPANEPTVTEPPSEEKRPASQAEQALTKDIAELNAKITQFNAQLGRAQVIVLRSDELIAEITKLRRSKFTDKLLGTGKSLLAPSLWLSALQDIVPLANGVFTILVSGSTRVLSEVPKLFFSALFGGLAVVVLLLRFFKPLRLSRSDRKDEERDDAMNVFYGRSGFNALQEVVRNVIFFSLLPGLLLLVLNQADVLASRLSDLLGVVFETLVYYAVARGLSRAILAPDVPLYRLVPLNDRQAIHMHRVIIVCLTIALIGFLVADFARTLVASADFIVLTYGVMSVGFVCMAAVGYFLRPSQEGGQEWLASGILIVSILLVFALIGLLIAFIAPFFGYPFFAAFAVGQVILAGIIAAILYICFTLLDSFLGTETATSQADTAYAIRTIGDKERRYAQLMMLLSGAGKILLTFFGVSFFAASWGLDTSGIWQDLLRLFQEIKIGEFTISPATIATSLLVLVIGVLITRSVQGWLSTRFLPTTKLDIGLRNSITTSMGYVGFIASVMVAFSQAGLDLSSLAIVAGALSLGIGFGLQSIVSNFVSGIILLAERPIKAGDWIVVGGEEGTVRKISVRSTEIETFDRATVIVPNADFISGAVKNMMYGSKIGRITINIGVGYDSDPEKVQEILLDVAKKHPLVLTYPEISVIFMDFGASSLDFQLRGFIADCGNSLNVRSDLRFAIFKRLKEENIEIPFPQRDLNIKVVPTEALKQVSNELDALAPKPKNSRRRSIVRRDEMEVDGEND